MESEVIKKARCIFINLQRAFLWQEILTTFVDQKPGNYWPSRYTDHK